MRTPFVIIQTSTCPFSNCRSWPSNTKQALISFSFGRNDIFVLKNHYWTAYMSLKYKGFPGGSVVKKSPASAGDLGLTPGSGRLPWRRKWQPAPVFLPEKSHGQSSLADYSPWGWKELDTTKCLCLFCSAFCSFCSAFFFYSALQQIGWRCILKKRCI